MTFFLAIGINFQVDYKRKLKEGNMIIAVFKDSGQGFLSLYSAQKLRTTNLF
jgi:hypothetical protein